MTHRRLLILPLALLLVAFGIGDFERGNRLYREGRIEEAVEAYRSALQDGNRSPELRYNLGTALLRLGRLDEAEQHFEAALQSVDPEVRQPTHFNLGNRFLSEALNAPEEEEAAAERARLLDSAVDAYKQALRLEPQDADAKWNLELALREREELPPSPAGGEGDEQEQDSEQQENGESGDPSQSPSQPDPSPGEPEEGEGEQPAPGELTREQAERILGAVEEGERELYRDQLREGRRESPVLRNW